MEIDPYPAPARGEADAPPLRVRVMPGANHFDAWHPHLLQHLKAGELGAYRKKLCQNLTDPGVIVMP